MRNRYKVKAKFYLKWIFILVGIYFIIVPPSDRLIDERIFGLLLVWMLIDITRVCK